MSNLFHKPLARLNEDSNVDDGFPKSSIHNSTVLGSLSQWSKNGKITQPLYTHYYK
jgi:hypothetical protein